ncbi:MAG: hypothetical protein KIH01_07190 [Candidatus Freyarchaeota archaeon]|nr:hypothetical protein [Candidatus Jordarchaeia archaeon]
MFFLLSPRGIISFLVGISFIFGIVYFVALGHTLADLRTVFLGFQINPWVGWSLLSPSISASVADYLIRPHTLATASPPAQTYVPIAALALGGFVMGLIRKHPLNSVFIGFTFAIIVIVAYGISLLFNPYNIIPGILGVSFSDIVLLFIIPSATGFIGSILTVI